MVIASDFFVQKQNSTNKWLRMCVETVEKLECIKMMYNKSFL